MSSLPPEIESVILERLKNEVILKIPVPITHPEMLKVYALGVTGTVTNIVAALNTASFGIQIIGTSLAATAIFACWQMANRARFYIQNEIAQTNPTAFTAEYHRIKNEYTNED